MCPCLYGLCRVSLYTGALLEIVRPSHLRRNGVAEWSYMKRSVLFSQNGSYFCVNRALLIKSINLDRLVFYIRISDMEVMSKGEETAWSCFVVRFASNSQ